MIARHLTLALCVCGLLAGCGQRRDPDAFRLITAAADGRLDTEATQQVVFSWDFATAGDLEAWTIENADGEGALTERGLALRSSSDDPFLWRRAAVEADAVDAIRVYLRAAAAESGGDTGSDPGMVQLFWAAADERFSITRQMALGEPSAELDDGILVYQFPVADDPSWEGGIGRLRLDPTNLPRMRVLLGRVEGIRNELPDPSLPRYVVLGSEQRLALLVPPDSPRTLTVDVPPSAVLRFGYGLLGGDPGRGARPAELSVSVAAAERRRAAQVQAAGRTLFTAAFAAAGDPATREWLEARVRLDGFAGQRLELRFESTVPAGDRGVPVVSNPELYSTRPTAQPPNVVLICVDTLRADHLSLYGYRKVTSPAIDAWARDRAVTFQTAVAPSPWTLPSTVSMLTGLDALGHGVNYLETSISPSLPTLTGLLRRAGYRTAAVTGGGFLGLGYGFEHGFDRFRWWQGQSGSQDELTAHSERALDWLNELSDRPFFLFFHTYETHSPYHRREPYFTAFGGRPQDLGAEPLSTRPEAGPEEAGFRHDHHLAWAGSDNLSAGDVDAATLAALYDSGIAHVDAVVGRLLEHLRLLDLAADTIVVLTSDHGESLGEHGLVAHGNLYDHNLLVPLVISYPRQLAAKRVEQQVRSVDLMPTILALAGVEAPPGLDGTSLLPLMKTDGDETTVGDAEAPPAWSYGGWPNYGVSVRRGGELKYIFNDAPWPATCGREELYELGDDPVESDNRVESSRAIAQLRRQTQAYLQRNASGLLLELVNREPAPFELTLTGPQFLPWTVKWLAGACPGVSRPDIRSIRITLAPNQSTTLVWQRAQAQALELTAAIVHGTSAERGEPVTLEDPQLLRDSRLLRYVDRQWRWTEGRAADSWTGVRVWWSEPRGVEPQGAPPSPEAVRQLEALGYLQ